MNVLSQDAYYWQFIHHLVANVGMSAFLVKSGEKEIWLEKVDTVETTVVRVIRRDMDWSNYIARDLENLAQDGEKVRKELKSRRLKIINIYISSFLPVDSYEGFFEKMFVTKNNRLNIQTFIIDSEKANELGVSRLSELLDCQIPEVNDESSYTNEDIQRFRGEVVAISDKKFKKEKELFTYGKPYFTFILLLNVIMIFGLMEYVGSSTSLLTLVEFGAKYDPLIVQGEWWRFFSAIFLHIGILHLAMNSLALFYLGGAVERIYGTKRFIFIYLIAGIFGSISSFAFNSQVSAGASGAIFGCFGALLYFGIVHRKLFLRTLGINVIVILIINLALGFIIPMIDNSAHIGGLIGGFLASSILHLPKHQLKKHQFVSLLVTVGSLCGLLLYGFTIQENSKKVHLINIQIGQELLQRGDFEKAYPLLKEAVEYDVDIIEANFLLAYSEAKLGLLKDAEKNLLITIEQRPYFHEAHFNLSLVYFELRQYLDAYRSVVKALELNPNTDDYVSLKNTIEKILKKTG
jgi:rhomboid protease GluP